MSTLELLIYGQLAASVVMLVGWVIAPAYQKHFLC